MRYLVPIWFSLLITALSSCKNEDPILGGSVSHYFYVRNNNVDLPVLVEGNTSDKIFVLYIHGGPESGGIVESEDENFWNKLEGNYAVVYYDQRGIGMSNGNFKDSSLTIEQYVDDLDKIISVLKSRYGNDISLFLLGGSWGGFVGTAYISTSDFQSKINGWIEIGGAHNMPLIKTGLKDRIQVVAEQQIGKGLSIKEWESLLKYAELYDLDDTSFENWLAILQKYESLISLLEKDGELQFKPDNFKIPEEVNILTILWNDSHNKVGEKLLNKYYTTNLTPRLSKVTTPSLFVWGEYDFASPPILGFDAYENIGTPASDKKLVIIDHADHTILRTKPEQLLILINEFVSEFRR